MACFRKELHGQMVPNQSASAQSLLATRLSIGLTQKAMRAPFGIIPISVRASPGLWGYRTDRTKGTQYCDGLRGPLVIYDDNDPHKHLYDGEPCSLCTSRYPANTPPSRRWYVTFRRRSLPGLTSKPQRIRSSLSLTGTTYLHHL